MDGGGLKPPVAVWRWHIVNPNEFDPTDLGTLFASVGIALLLGVVLGFDRERRRKPAGLRTHALVCVASCLAMMTAVAIGHESRQDALRGLNAVMTGIGFIGAGAILRHGRIVHGLTTGATIWAAGAVGAAVGAGWFIGACVTTLATVVILTGLRPVENAIAAAGVPTCLKMSLAAGKPFPREMLKDLTSMRFQVLAVKLEEGSKGRASEVAMYLEGPAECSPEFAAAIARGHDHISDVRLEAPAACK